MKNNQALEMAAEILQGFEIENDTIRCTDGSALQALIPYMKRLIQLFPEIKENTKRALSSGETRKDIYQLQTSSYLEQVPFKFKPDILIVTEFLRSDHLQVLNEQMADGEERTGLMKVY